MFGVNLMGLPLEDSPQGVLDTHSGLFRVEHRAVGIVSLAQMAVTGAG